MTQMAQLIKGGYPNYGDYTPPGTAGVNDMNAGDVAVVGQTLVICTGGAKRNGAGTGITAGTIGAVVVRGGYFLVKTDGAIPVRSRVYWDPVNLVITLNRGTNLQFGITGDVASTGAGQYIPCEFAPGKADQSVTTIAATGTGASYADAAPLVDGANIVTGANGTVGTALPTPWPGRQITVKNNANAVLKMWPNSGTGQINALAAGVAQSVAAYASADYWSDGAVWYSNPTVPS